jgi:hypothetical protein
MDILLVLVTNQVKVSWTRGPKAQKDRPQRPTQPQGQINRLVYIISIIGHIQGGKSNDSKGLANPNTGRNL